MKWYVRSLAWRELARCDGAMSRSWRRCYMYVLALTLFIYLIYSISYPTTCSNGDYLSSVVQLNKEPVVDKNGKVYNYDFNMPLIFIGGMPRSGTTLMRAMLDAHSEVRCGEETRVVPRIVQMRSHWLKSPKESMRLKEAGLENDVLNAAIRSFILEVIVRHGEPAPRLCNKDPFTMKYSTYLHELFPKAKFIFMVRDGRATVHSIITRKVTISGFDLKSYRQCLERWNTAVQTMYTQCRELGPEWCLPVYYEQLVLHPREVMQKILKFLDVNWEETVLHHEDEVGKPGGISISKVERSSDQIIKPVNLDALSKWVGVIPEDVVADMPNIAPMLSVLGYDPYANPPNYGKPDEDVKKLTKQIHDNPSVWQQKAKQLLNRTHYVPEEFSKTFYDKHKRRHL